MRYLTYLLTSYFTYLIYLLIYLLTSFLNYLLIYLLPYLLTSLFTYLLYLLAYLLTYLLPYLLTYLLTFLLTYLLTYSLQQNPSLEAKRYSSSQEILRILCGEPRRFITVTSARHLSVSWATSIQSRHPHPTSWRSILILSSHLVWVSQVASVLQISPPKPWIRLFYPPYALHAPPISFFSMLSPE